MSRDFSKVSPQIWDSERFRRLPDDGARLAYLYFLSNCHQNSIGCYKLPVAYACADLTWGEATFVTARDAVIAQELIAIDDATREILIARWFKHNPPTNVKHMMGACRLVSKIESPALRTRSGTELNAAWKKWQDEHRSASSDAPTPSGETSHVQISRMRAVPGGR